MREHTPRILIADDDALYRMLFGEILNNAGLGSKIVASGSQAAMEMISGPQDFDCVILDIFMDGIDGFETCHMIRRLNRDIPIIMVTGDTRLETEAMAHGLNISAFLRKPFSETKFLSAVFGAMNREQANNIAAC